MQPGNKVILNTAILYAKMMLSIVVGLLSTRLVLISLGVEDYGIYNLVAGIVSMLSFLNTSLAVSTQRFLSFSLGKDDAKLLEKVFYYSFVLHFLIGIGVVLLVEVLGRFGIQNILSIGPDKINDALTILHFLSSSIFFSILAVPYIAILISRENMFLLSVIEILEAILKLSGVFGLLFYMGNRLILYAAIISITTFISLVLKIVFCWNKYRETQISLSPLNDKILLKDLTSFAGWYTFVSIGSIGRFQGIQVLLNIFYGIVVNAAYGIANQVNGLMQFFATAILQSIRPQIVKSEGAKNRERVNRLSLIACRYMFFLCAIFSIPLILEMPYVLGLWLKNPPEYTIGFCRLVLSATLLFMITSGLGTAIDATGKIKYMYIILGCLHLVNIPVSYILLKMEFSVYSVLWVIIIEEFVCMWIRIYLAKIIVGISVANFLRSVIFPILVITAITFAIGSLCLISMDSCFLRFIFNSVLCICAFFVLCWYYGIDALERERIIGIYKNVKSKLIKNNYESFNK